MWSNSLHVIIMALTHQRVLEVADFAKKSCDETKKLLLLIEQFLDTNSSLSIDWGNIVRPAFINEDSDGNLDGRRFSRQSVSNAINSLDQIRKVLRNMTTSQGDHLGNLNQLADAEDIPK